MAFDGIVTRALCRELQSLIGARVDKVSQPGRDEIILGLRLPGQSPRLLLSAHAQQARVHLTQANYPNPPHPPAYCMLLRKYLERARLVRIHQHGWDRVLEFTFIQDLGYEIPKEWRLVVEIMGRHSNIVLISPTGEIIDGIHRVTPEMSRYRTIQPGEPYLPPPPQEKTDPNHLDPTGLAAVLETAGTQPASKVLVHYLAGLSPLLAGEILFRAGLSPQATADEAGEAVHPLSETIHAFMNQLERGEIQPCLYREGGFPKDFSCFLLTQFPPSQVETRANLGELVAEFYEERRDIEGLQQARNNLLRPIGALLDRVIKKAQIQQEDLAQAQQAEELRHQGELLTAHLHLVEHGMHEITVTDYYDPEQGELTIPLNPHRSPSENVQAIFRRYQKLRRVQEQLGSQLEQTRHELAYLQDVTVSIEGAESLLEIWEIQDELIAEGISGLNPPKKKKEDPRPAPPRRYRSQDGYTILVGRNNRQNDRLSLKQARPGDLWFHTQKIPGTHVILQTQGRRRDEIPPTTITEAALLAAYYSKAKSSSQVPVDMTEVSNLRKPRGARPGFVIYEGQETLYITPRPENLPPQDNDQAPSS